MHLKQLLLTLSFLFFLFLSRIVSAQPVGLDPTFGGTGIVFTSISSILSDEGVKVKVQPDGRIVVGGQKIDYTNQMSGRGERDFEVVRYHSDGTLDLSFDTDGMVITTVATDASEEFIDLHIQSDRKILATGYVEYPNGSRQVMLVRYHSDGSLDNSFGTNGIVLTTPADNIQLEQILDAELLPNGKLLVGGIGLLGTGQQMLMFRYHSDGSLDTSFNGDGQLSYSSIANAGYFMTARSDGKILIAGRRVIISGSSRSWAIVLSRLHADGSVDTSFGNMGHETLPFSFPHEDGDASSVLIQPDGKIVVAGFKALITRGNPIGYLARYHENGGLDQSFDFDGIALKNDFMFSSIVLQADGKIVGSYLFIDLINGTRGHLFRYNTDGSPDLSFNGTGFLTQMETFPYRDVVLQTDGKILATTSSSNFPSRFATARYTGVAPSLSLGALSSSVICAATAFSVPFTSNVFFGTGNVFTVELSNASGSFASPTVIGTGTASPVSATIPATVAAGAGYRIRVRSSNPALVSADNGSNLTISKPTVTLLHLAPYYCQSVSLVPLSAGVSAPGTGYFTLNGSPLPAAEFSPSALGAGSYQVGYVFTETATGCPASTAQIVEVKAPPVVSITGVTPLYCKNSGRVTPSATISGGNFYLDGGTAAISSFEPQQMSTGVHQLVYRYTDSFGCTGADTVSFEIKPLPVVHITNIASFYCQDAAPVTPQADVAGGAFYLDGGSTAITQFTPGQLLPGNHHLEYRYTDSFGCTGIDYVSFEIRPLPRARLTGIASRYCSSAAPFALTATHPGGLFRIDGQPTTGASLLVFNPSVLSAGTHRISYTYTENGCSNVDEVTTEVFAAPVVDLGGDVAGGCSADGAVLLNAEHPRHSSPWNLGQLSYLWNTGATTPSISVSHSGTYIVTVTHAQGCQPVSDTVEVRLYTSPVVGLGADLTVCGNEKVELNAVHTSHNSSFSYKWSTGETTPKIKVTGRGIQYYYVTVTDNTYPSKCTTTDTIMVTFKDAPVLNLGADMTLCAPTQLPYLVKATDLSHLPGTTYRWFNPQQPGTTISTRGNLEVSRAGMYAVTVTHPNGCTATDTIQIYLNADPVVTLTGADLAGNCQLRDTLHVQTTNILNMSVTWSGPGIVYTDPTKLWVIVDKSGRYSVTVVDISKPTKCTTVRTADVYLADFPLAVIKPNTARMSVCQDSIISLNAGDVSHASTFKYEWRELKTGAVISNKAQLDVAYATMRPASTFDPVRYSVTVTPPSGCASRDTIEVTFQRKSAAAIDKAYPKQICLGQSVSLKATGGDSYKWNWVDPATGSAAGATTPSVTVKPTVAGTYRFIVQASLANSTTCKPTYDTATVIVNPALVARIAKEEFKACEDQPVEVDVFEGSHPFSVTYQWRNLATGEIVATTSRATFKFSTMKPQPAYTATRYEARVIDNVTGCSASDTIRVIFERKAVAAIRNYPEAVCVGDRVTLTATGGTRYLWSTGDTTSSITVKSDSTGTFRYIVGARFDNLCSATYDTAFIRFVGKPVAVANPVKRLRICLGSSQVLTASGGVRYQWAHGPSTASTAVSPARDTWYRVDVFNEVGCKSTDSVLVRVIPTVQLPSTVTACEGDTIRLNASHPDSTAKYLWNDGDTSRIKVITRRPGVYSVRVKIADCQYTATTNVIFKLKPRIAMVRDTILCFAKAGEQETPGRHFEHHIIGRLTNREPGETYYYTWYKGSDLSVIEMGQVQGNQVQLKLTSGVDTAYILRVRNSIGCESSSRVRVREICEPRLRMPDAFTPNGDGLNDTFAPLATDIHGIQIRIFQRWGEVVFDRTIEKGKDVAFSFEELEGWDGTYNGKPCPTDAYQYVVVYWAKDSKGNNVRKRVTGTVHLIRK